MFVLIVVILILIYAIVSNGVLPLIITLSSFVTTLPVFNNDNNDDYNGLLIVLNIKLSAYSLGDYNPNIYNLFI